MRLRSIFASSAMAMKIPQIGSRLLAPFAAIVLSRIVASLQIDSAIPPQPMNRRNSGVVVPISLIMQAVMRFSAMSIASTTIASDSPLSPNPEKTAPRCR